MARGGGFWLVAHGTIAVACLTLGSAKYDPVGIFIGLANLAWALSYLWERP